MMNQYHVLLFRAKEKAGKYTPNILERQDITQKYKYRDEVVFVTTRCMKIQRVT